MRIEAEGGVMFGSGLLGALTWFVVAVPGLLAPDRLLGGVGQVLGSVDAHNEARALYGGLMLALAGVQGLLALRRGSRRLGMALWTVLLAGLVSGRLVSVLVDGVPPGMARTLMAFEGTGLLVGALLLWLSRADSAVRA